MVISKRDIWRYTSLSSLFHILDHKALTLLPPYSWEDKTDVHFLSEYKRQKKLEAVFALCLSGKKQTYHHWHVFSKSSEGVCITFNKKRLLADINRRCDIRHGLVEYLSTDELKAVESLEKLPFIKQKRYSDEGEYRLLFESKSRIDEAPSVPISINSISRITLSPWLHQSLKAPIVDALKDIRGCDALNIQRSTLIESGEWNRFASNFDLI